MNDMSISDKDKKVQINYTDKKNEQIYFPELDGLRFLAFLLVFIHHHSLFSKIPNFSILHTYGWIGVDLFFALSSFLFTKLLVAEYNKTKTISFKKFYIRRIFRIWPLYFLFIVFSVTLYFFINHTISNYDDIRIIGLLTFSDNIMTAIFGYNSIPFAAHLWTIAYEEQFYIFIPIIILVLVRTSSKAKLIFLISIFVLFNSIRLAFIINNVERAAFWVVGVTHFESIIMGMVIGFGGLDFMLIRIKPLIFGLIGVLSFVLLLLLPPIDEITYWLMVSYLLIGISTSLVLFTVLNSRYLKLIFSRKLFVFLGKRSYGLYVYHLLGNGIANQINLHNHILPPSSLMSFLYSLIVTIIISILSYRIVETPFLKLKKRFEVIISRPV